MIYTINKVEEGYAELAVNGIPYNFDHRRGGWNIWNISLFLDGAEDLVQKRDDFMVFRSIKHSCDVSFVIFKQILKVKPVAYKYKYTSDATFEIIVEHFRPGKSSHTLTTRLIDAASGKILIERFVKFGAIDNVSRKSIKNPDWFLSKYGKLKIAPSELNRTPIPEPPTECFKYRTFVRYSDLDLNFHANHSFYIKSSIDCVTDASFSKRLVHFTGDMCRYPVVFITVDYIGECFVGDEIKVIMWQHVDDVSKFSFMLYRIKDNKKLTFIYCNFGLKEMESDSVTSKM